MFYSSGQSGCNSNYLLSCDIFYNVGFVCVAIQSEHEIEEDPVTRFVYNKN